MSTAAWAICPLDDASGLDVDNGETCVAALDSYSNDTTKAVLRANGGGSVLSVTGADVFVSGGAVFESAAVWALQGGIVNISGNLDITVVGGDHYVGGIASQRNGSIVRLGTSTRVVHHGGPIGGGGLVVEQGTALITAAGLVTVITDGAPALLATGGGRLDLKDVDLTVGMNGNNNPNGIVVAGPSSNVTYANGLINTVHTGLRAITGGAIVGLGTTGLTTSADDAFGASSEDVGSSITINGRFNTTTTGTGAVAAIASSGGAIALNGGGLIQTQGDSASGIAATGLSSSVTGDQLTVSTAGLSAIGVVATDKGHVGLTNSTIATTGDGAVGMSASGGASAAGTNIDLSTSGADAHGLAANEGGSFTLSGSSIAVTGANASALSLVSTLGATQTAVIANSTLSSTGAPAILAAAGASTLGLTASTVSGNGVLLDVGSTGVANLSVTADGSRLIGSARTAAGSSSNVSLTNGTIWTLPANSNVTTLVNRNSTVSFAANPAFTTLTVDGNYSGDNGAFQLNTHLGADGSGSDLLHVAGDTSGTSTLNITNASGPGAMTTADGIKVVQVDGLSNGAFSLRGHYVLNGQQFVVAGAYGYALYKNGVADPLDGDWYLRSEIMQIPVDPTDPVDPVIPAGPVFQGGVPTHEIYPQVLLGLNRLPTLQQRVGNRLWDRHGNGPASSVPQTMALPSDVGVTVQDNGVWGRLEGSRAQTSPEFSRTGTNYTVNALRMLAGADGLLAERSDGRVFGGLNVQYDHATAKTRSFYGDGVISTDGYGFGGTLTWSGDTGFYVDGQAHVTWYNSNLSSILANRSLVKDNGGFGYAVSFETGQRIALNDSWSLTPQAQLTFSSVAFDAFDDSFGARISLDRSASLQSRIGLAMEHQSSWSDSRGELNRAALYGTGNLLYEHLNGTSVNVAGVGFDSRNDRLRGNVGFGGSYNWADDRYSLFGGAQIGSSLEHLGTSMSYQANIGLQIKW